MTAAKQQNLCADAGYVGKKAHEQIQSRGYIPQVRSRGEEIDEKARNPNYKPRRCVVEVCHAWLNRFRKLRVRFEKTDRSYMALIHLAAAIIAFRKCRRRTLYKQLRNYLGEVFRKQARQKECRNEEKHLMSDRVHG